MRDLLIEQQLRNAPISNLDWFTNSAAINGAIAELSSDQPASKLATDQTADTISSARLTAYLDVALSVSLSIAGDAARLQTIAGSCASNSNNVSDTACVDKFVKYFATLAFRTPPLAEEINEIKSRAQNWSSLIGRILIHPRFLTHFERDETYQAKSSSYNLSDYEIEARLTSVFWKSLTERA